MSGARRTSIAGVGLVLLVLVAGSYFAFVEDDSNTLVRFLAVQTVEREEALRQRLESVAFRNKTVILTTLNKSWSENGSMVDLFLDSFKKGIGTSRLLNHLLVITLDRSAHIRCLQVHRHCYRLYTRGVDFSNEKVFMNQDYLRMMWRRVDFLRQILELGYNFVFTDADILWFRDPFPHFDPDADFEMACDRFNGRSWDLNNDPNGGFIHAVSNQRTIQLYRTWYKARLRYPNQHDQDVFNDIKFSREFTDIKLRVRFFDTRYFGGFCQVSRDLNEVSTMHANCCVKLERKLNDLRLLVEDWSRYLSLAPEQRKSQTISWSAPKECLHSWEH